MKTKFNGILTLLLAFTVHFAFAQKTVSGTVSDETGPLPGVSVLIKGTSTGTETDFDGKYTMTASEGDVLQYSYVGMETAFKTVGAASTYDVKMAGSNVLDEVIITAMGIKKSEKSIGYASQSVKSEELTKVKSTNIVNSLSGKIAGVNITNASSSPGSSSRIVLRGVSSIYGDTQPLVVVDGVPMDNTAYGNAASQGGGIDVPNGLADLNQNDIKDITILKGGPATALYGMRGANGVIVVTTKDGKGIGKEDSKVGITINSGVQFDRISFLPTYQNSYGQGIDSEYFEYIDGYGTTDSHATGMGGRDESWGPPLDVGLEFIQWNSFDGEAKPWVSAPDGVKNFYNTGVILNNNVALEGGTEKANYRISLGAMNQTGIMHNTGYNKYNAGGNVNFKMSEKWNAGLSFNYIRTQSDNLPSLGYDTTNNATQTAQLVWAARQIDFNDLRDWQNLPLVTVGNNAGAPLNWNQAYNNNPFWALEKNVNTLDKDRVLANINLGYKVLDNLTLSFKSGIDYFTSLNTSRAHFGTTGNQYGFYNETVRTRYGIDSNVILTYDTSIFEGLDLSLTLGANSYYNNYHRNYIDAPKLQVPGVFNISNTRDGVDRVITQGSTERKINSAFGMGSLSYNDYLFLEFTGRNDWASVLPIDANSFFYPSVTLSAIVSDMLGFDKSTVSFMKVRAGWAKVGSAGPLSPYSLNPTYSFDDNPWGTTPVAYLPGTLWNPNIKNETSTEYEIGIDSRFFSNKLRFDFTYYDKTTEDVILPVPVSASSGFTNAWDNAATISNKGIELNLSARILDKKDRFNLDLNLNFGKNTNLVDDIDDDPTTDNGAITLGSLWNADIQAREGEPMGVIYGPAFARDSNDEIIFQNGLPTFDPTSKILGNTTPDWTGGLGVNMSWKGLSFYTLFDVKKGGDIYSQTNSWGKLAGVLVETLEGREGGLVGDGVDINGGPNTTVVSSRDYFGTFYSQDVVESSVYDASFVKWRELSLGYTIPKKFFGNIGIEEITAGINVRNVMIIYKEVPHIDPESSFGNGTGGQGLEYAQLPPTRSYGVNMNIKF